MYILSANIWMRSLMHFPWLNSHWPELYVFCHLVLSPPSTNFGLNAAVKCSYPSSCIPGIKIWNTTVIGQWKQFIILQSQAHKNNIVAVNWTRPDLDTTWTLPGLSLKASHLSISCLKSPLVSSYNWPFNSPSKSLS